MGTLAKLRKKEEVQARVLKWTLASEAVCFSAVQAQARQAHKKLVLVFLKPRYYLNAFSENLNTTKNSFFGT